MKIESIKKELETLKEKNLTLLDLMIYDEIDCQLEEDLTDNEILNLMGHIENAYLKDSSCSLWSITYYCLLNRKKLNNMTTWDILEGASIYE